MVAPKRAGRFAAYAEGGERPAAVLVDIGQAPYAFKPNNKPSPYARLRDPDGRERHVWGVGLPEAVREASVAPGDGVVLRILRRETVEVDEACVDARGRPATRKKRVERNVWRAERRPDPARTPSLEALRDELAEAVGDRAYAARIAARAAGAEVSILTPDGGQARETTPDPSPERRGRGPKPSPTPDREGTTP